ncbi:MAG: carbon starvation protein A [Dysgonamonadaceae bacterium]|jgi:carbon starvation protein CstA|nr:carbon starvation protein A [Dysgonamonadaceae bacterium]
MITFLISIVLLVAGYVFYGKFIERVFGVDGERKTPAFTKRDGVDFLPMKSWRIFMIQFLNIAGLGPIFGAIMGAKFGVSSFLWIVFGSIFAGGVHDYIAGMMSLRMDGANLPEIHGKYLGRGVKNFMMFFMVLLMVLVGVVFITGPAALLAKLTPDFFNAVFWIVVIFAYYLLATLLPIDKIIGRFYPFFGACLLFMAAGILLALLYRFPALPEIWEGLGNTHPQAVTNPIFPMMFISIACGAISGFHATQSPIMARTMTSERQGRRIFYGAMLLEGIMALIWAAAASYFYRTPEGKPIFESGTNAAVVVDMITQNWLGALGAVLAILGVVFAPITSGDTAFRSARLIIADMLKINQKPIVNRLLIAVPLFLGAFGVLIYSMRDKDGFDLIWRYFAWANQTLAVVTLWAITVYLAKEKRCYLVALVPALFMTMVCSTFVFIAQREGFGLSPILSYSIGGAVTAVALGWFLRWKMTER